METNLEKRGGVGETVSDLWNIKRSELQYSFFPAPIKINDAEAFGLFSISPTDKHSKMQKLCYDFYYDYKTCLFSPDLPGLT